MMAAPPAPPKGERKIQDAGLGFRLCCEALDSPPRSAGQVWRCYLSQFILFFLIGLPLFVFGLAGCLLVCTDVYFGDGLMPGGMQHKRLRCNDAAMKE